MKRIGVLGGISAQATMDFEARFHRCSQARVPQEWNHGYPPMVVWYHRGLPIRLDAAGLPLVPMSVAPGLVEAAAWLGKAVDFLVVPCNSAHVGLGELREAAGCPVLSMVDVVLAEVERRRPRRVGVLGFHVAPPLYTDPLTARGIACERIEGPRQTRLDAGIRAVMEGADGRDDGDTARGAVADLRAKGVDAVILGCTEIPLLLGAEREGPDLIDPVALLADAAVRHSME